MKGHQDHEALAVQLPGKPVPSQQVFESIMLSLSSLNPAEEAPCSAHASTAPPSAQRGVAPDGEKAALEQGEDPSASGNVRVGKLRRNQMLSGDDRMDFKLRVIIRCFISLQLITISVSSGCSVIYKIMFPYLINLLSQKCFIIIYKYKYCTKLEHQPLLGS